jgi:exonuclease III
MKVFFFLLFAFPSILLSQRQIILDEDYSDWSQPVLSFNDASGDGNSSGIDITDLKISNDQNYLFLYFDIKKEINIQASNNLTLFIDIDNNVNTGLLKNGIGADLVYKLGSRTGTFYTPTSTTTIWHSNINLVTAPTVTSSKFELGLLRKFQYGNNTTNMSNTIKVILSDESTNGDRAPDTGGITYAFNNNIKFEPVPFAFQKQKPEYLRFMSYNVLKDNLFKSTTQAAYNRIFKATKPDIIGFCEIYDNSSQVTANLIEGFLPSTGTQKWFHSEVNPDIRVVSRYPIIDKKSINGNGAFLIEIGNENLVFIVAHLPCCENETGRQQEVDNIMAFIRTVRFGTSSFQVKQNTPIVIVGDMNLVGLRSQQQTFLTGDIFYNNIYGPDFDPDWDDSFLDDSKPITTNLPTTYTWNSLGGSYSAGRLDYVIYTGSVMSLKNSFALWPAALNANELSSSGLQASDVEITSDHLPVICDFKLASTTSSSDLSSNKEQIKYYQSGNQLFIEFEQFKYRDDHIRIYDINGYLIYEELIKGWQQNYIFDLSNLGITGIYYLNLSNNTGTKTFKILK